MPHPYDQPISPGIPVRETRDNCMGAIAIPCVEFTPLREGDTITATLANQYRSPIRITDVQSMNETCILSDWTITDQQGTLIDTLSNEQVFLLQVSCDSASSARDIRELFRIYFDDPESGLTGLRSDIMITARR